MFIELNWKGVGSGGALTKTQTRYHLIQIRCVITWTITCSPLSI